MISDLSLEEIKAKLEKTNTEIRSINEKIREASRDSNKSKQLIGNLALDAFALEGEQWELIKELFKRIKK